MNAFPWARRPTPTRILRLAPERPLFIVSDVHLGDGTRSDAFMGKEREFMAFLEMVRDENAHLVIAGDIIDFSQALTFTRVLRAHGEIFGLLSDMAGHNGVTYLWGNHDYDIALYRDLLRWEVCSSVELGQQIQLMHGHQLDPYIANNMREAALATLIHHQVERVLDTWIRVPLEDFYTMAGRMNWWLARYWVGLARWFYRLLARLGMPRKGDELEAYISYWVQSQLGDPMNLWPAVCRHLARSPWRVLVCGHSHQPGSVEVAPGKRYVNTGSWTFRNAQYVRWDGARFEVRDWISGQVFTDERYRPMLEGRIQSVTLDRWYQEEYLGWLRFRCGELKQRGLETMPWYMEETTRSEEEP